MPGPYPELPHSICLEEEEEVLFPHTWAATGCSVRLGWGQMYAAGTGRGRQGQLGSRARVLGGQLLLAIVLL